tara:strand:- start:2850 stop:3362 length:513 start_codon:yes stop_codon:yes gene_type:complete
LLFSGFIFACSEDPNAARRKQLEQACTKSMNVQVDYHESIEDALDHYLQSVADYSTKGSEALPTMDEYIEQYWCHLEDRFTMNAGNDPETVKLRDTQMRNIVLERQRSQLEGKDVELVSYEIKSRKRYEDIEAIYLERVVVTADGKPRSLRSIKLIVGREGRFRVMRIAP